MVTSRWSIEQVESVAPSAAAVTAAQPLASPSRWTGLGADNAALWGSCQGSGSEPYDTMVDHQHVGFTCTCPSRKTPCKHALALLLLWVRDQVVDTPPPAHVSTWIDRRSARRTTASRSADGDGASSDAASESTAPEPAASETVEAGDAIGESDPTQPVPQPDRNTAHNDRVERMHGGLSELDRWLDDRIRTGLADPSLARYATWDDLAARLVDAQAGSLANRIRRLAGLNTFSPTISRSEERLTH